jgi:tetratricopeptide (TPR) repeat protein
MLILRPLLSCLAAVGMGLFVVAPMAQAQSRDPVVGCGSLVNPVYGPFDYRRANAQQRDLVESAHFTPGVETLSHQKTGPFGWDIGYTLRAFPNHPRALLTMQRLAEKEKKNPPNEAIYTVDCYYDRAIRFQPEDYVVRMLFANYLIEKGGRNDDATAHLEYARSRNEDNPFTQFNVGMLYFDMKNYDKALEQAHRAMALGMPRQELKDRLKSVNRWLEPEEVAAAAAAAASAASAPAEGASAPASGAGR